MDIDIRFKHEPTDFTVGHVYVMRTEKSTPYIAAMANGKPVCLVSLKTGQIYYNQSPDQYIDVTSKIQVTEK